MRFPNETPPANNQDAFERAIRWIIRPGGSQCLEFWRCVYRSKDGENACAIGAMMPDEMAKKTVGGIYSLMNMDEKIKDYFKNCSIDLLMSLQGIHDSFWGNRPMTIDVINMLVKNHKLTIPADIQKWIDN